MCEPLWARSVTGVRSRTTTPLSMQAWRRPHASRAGSTSAVPRASKTPPRYDGELHARAGLLRPEDGKPLSELIGGLRGLLEAGQLMRFDGDVELPRPDEVAVDGELADRQLDRVEVLMAQAEQIGHLVRPALHAVAEAMGQGRRDESAVAPGRALGDAAALDEQDDAPRIRLLGEQRGPQSGESAADDDKVGPLSADEFGRGRRAFGSIQPVDRAFSAREGAERRWGWGVAEEHRDSLKTVNADSEAHVPRRPTSPFRE